MAKLFTLRLIPGVKVKDATGSYVIVDLLNKTEVLVEDEAGRRDKRSASELIVDVGESSPRQANLLSIPQGHWERASEIAEALRPLIEMGPGKRTKRDVEGVSESLGYHIATVYRWLTDYEETGLVSSLLRKTRSDKGKKKIDERIESIIKDCIESIYLTSQRPTQMKAAKEVRKRCIEAGLTPPDPNTVRARIQELDDFTRVRRREGYKAADERYRPIMGSFPGADYPLAVVQIDHTPMDVIVVDDVHRLSINRPHLTLAIDVCTKMVVGFCISLDPPGALSTGLCISQAILSKDAILRERGIEGLDWPCWGMMRTIHTDNAKEFRGTMLGRAAEEYGLISQRRPKGRPRYGGHIERAFRTYMTEVHEELPGTTFSNTQEKLEYDSEGKAVMTLSALECWFTLFLLGVYHQSPHDGNDGIPPIVKWEREILGGPDGGLGRGIPARFPDEEKLRLDFMPYFERTIQEYGVAFEGVTYWSDSLRRFIHAKDPSSQKSKRMFLCRYDPRDLSRIWIHEPDSGLYIMAPYRSIARPSISIWELRLAKKKLREESKSVTNEELIFKTIDKMREIVSEESRKSKTARRIQQRQKSWEKAQSSAAAQSAELKLPKRVPPPVVEVEMDFTPFEGIRES